MTDSLRPSDDAAHLSPEQLEDLLELPDEGADASGAGRHLNDCPACTAALADQRRVRDRLRSAPDPGPMPDEVVARLDAALAAAARERAAVGSGDLDLGHPATVLPMGAAREHRAGRLRPSTGRAVKALVGVAAAALIGIGGYAALHQSAPAASASKAATDSSAAGAALPSSGVTSGAVRAQASGTAYTKANILAKVAGLLDKGPANPPAAGTAAPTPLDLSGSTTLESPAGLTACADTLSGTTGVRPLLVDLATFEGKPAAIIVLPAGSGKQIWVVSRTCTPANDGTMYFATVG